MSQLPREPRRKPPARPILRLAALVLLSASLLLLLASQPLLPSLRLRRVQPRPPSQPPPPALPSNPTHPRDIAAAQIAALLSTPHARHLQANLPTTARFILYRALGNDLPPRHSPTQTLTNLRFILDHEPPLPNLHRRWYLNRHVRSEMELQLIQLLLERNETFTRDPLDFVAYAAVDFNFPRTDTLHTPRFANTAPFDRAYLISPLTNDKNQFIIHNNHARNAMLDLGRASGARYVLPWDGNCCLNERAWRAIESAINATDDSKASTTARYFAVPMARITNNSLLQNPEYTPPSAGEEPQLIFRSDTTDRFNEQLRYGLMPKIEMLRHLRVSGYDKPRPRRGYSRSVPEGVMVGRVGWVARLFSGAAALEKAGAASNRGKSRSRGVEQLAAEASLVAARRQYGYGEDTLLWFDEQRLRNNREMYREGRNAQLQALVEQLVSAADEEMGRDVVYSVVNKRRAGPSGDKHDYTSRHPDFCKDESKVDGIPYVRTEVGQECAAEDEDDDEEHDRAEFEKFAGNVTVLTLAGWFSGEDKYSKQAAKLVRGWFLDEQTRMNANLKYARMEYQSRTGEGSASGVLDITGLVVVLDMCRLLGRSQALSGAEWDEVKRWAESLAGFLQSSKQGKGAYASAGAVGPALDAVCAAAYAACGRFREVVWHTSVARARLRGAAAGGGLEAAVMWVWVGRIAARVGVDVWRFDGGAAARVVRDGVERARRAGELRGRDGVEMAAAVGVLAGRSGGAAHVGRGVDGVDGVARRMREVRGSRFGLAGVVDGGAARRVAVPRFWNLG